MNRTRLSSLARTAAAAIALEIAGLLLVHQALLYA